MGANGIETYCEDLGGACMSTSENLLTHCSLETPKRVIGKQCRPRSDAEGLHCLQIVQSFFPRNI